MRAPFVPLLLTLAACGDVDDVSGTDNVEELITTVELTFAPVGGGEPVVATWADPEGDGDPVVDPIPLAAGADHALSVAFLNELADPPEDLTQEVADESDEHQVFFGGGAVEDGLLAVTYADEDANGFPVGLSAIVAATGAGAGELVVTLRHLPPQDGEPVKTGDLADVVATEGLGAIPGETDVTVTFAVTVP